MDAVRLEYDLDVDTAVAAAVAFHSADPGPAGATAAARRLNAGYGLFVVGVFAGLYLFRAPAEMIAALGAAVGLAIVAVNWPGRKARHDTELIFRRLLADPAGAAALGRRTVEFTPARLVVTTGYSREEYNWSAVLRVTQMPDFLILTLPGPRPLAIPRAAFPADDGFDRIADDLRAVVGGTL